MAKDGVPIVQPINQDAAVRAIITDSKLSEPLYNAMGVDIAKLKRSIVQEISRGIVSDIPYADIAGRIELRSKIPLHRAKTIARTEGHRIQEEGSHEARKVAQSKGARVVKQWDATLDSGTRPTHRMLDGQIR